jgi:hypothetical protein
MGKNEPLRDTQDAPAKAEPPRPSLIEFLSDPAFAVEPEVELDLRRSRRTEDRGTVI